MIIAALNQKVPPTDARLTAINTDIRDRQRASADQPIHVGCAILGAVLQVECGPADIWSAGLVDARMEYILAGKIEMNIPVLVVIRTPRQAPDSADLFAIQQITSLRSI